MHKAGVGRSGMVHDHIYLLFFAVAHQVGRRLQRVTLGTGGHLHRATLCSNFIGNRTAFKKKVKEIVMGRVFVHIAA